jgi:hypothetical protein
MGGEGSATCTKCKVDIAIMESSVVAPLAGTTTFDRVGRPALISRRNRKHELRTTGRHAGLNGNPVQRQANAIGIGVLDTFLKICNDKDSQVVPGQDPELLSTTGIPHFSHRLEHVTRVP